MNKPPKLLLITKSFVCVGSHAGLGVSALNCQKVLREHGIDCHIIAVRSVNEIRKHLEVHDFTHIVISAPWVPTADLAELAYRNPYSVIVVNTHSNVGFLQADRSAVKLVRESIHLETGSANFHVAANCRYMQRWLMDAYSAPCLYLPNLYWLNGMTRTSRPVFEYGTLRVGCFGANRPLKNHVTAAAAAIEMSQRLRVDLEFHISSGRTEGGAVAISAMEEMFSGLPHAKLVHSPWASWPQFRRVVAQMHLLMQPSFTESFNMVTADGIAEGVPSVVSEAIEWVPDYWKADNDDVFEVARVGRHLIHDRAAPEDGYQALLTYNDQGVRAWRKFLRLAGC